MTPVKDIEKRFSGKEFLKGFEVCEMLRISNSKLKRIVKEGSLKRFRVGKAHNSPNLYKTEDVLNLINIK